MAYSYYKNIFLTDPNPTDVDNQDEDEHEDAVDNWKEFTYIYDINDRIHRGMPNGWRRVFNRLDGEVRIYCDDQRGASETQEGLRVRLVPDRGDDPSTITREEGPETRNGRRLTIACSLTTNRYVSETHKTLARMM